jgi:hypothetical protein
MRAAMVLLAVLACAACKGNRSETESGAYQPPPPPPPEPPPDAELARGDVVDEPSLHQCIASCATSSDAPADGGSVRQHCVAKCTERCVEICIARADTRGETTDATPDNCAQSCRD